MGTFLNDSVRSVRNRVLGRARQVSVTLTNLKISTRIVLLSTLPFIGIFTLAGVQWSADKAIERELATVITADHLESTAAKIRYNAIQLYRHEKDFLASRDVKYADNHRAIMASIQNALAILAQSQVVASFPDRIAVLGGHLLQHAAEFDAAVKYALEMGLNHKVGLEGQLSRAANAIEAEIRTLNAGDRILLAQLLALRRHEKDYLLRHDAEYVTRFEGALIHLDELMLASTLVAAQKEGLRSQLGAYREAFLTWVQADMELRQHVQRLGEIFAQVEPDFDAIFQHIAKVQKAAHLELHAVRSRIARYWTVIMLALMMGVLGFAYIVSRSIIVPLRAITENFGRLSKGHLNVAIAGQDQRNEIGALARNLADFQQTSAQATRWQAAVEAASCNFMITDIEGRIIAVNASATGMFRAAESDLQKELPTFSADGLIGTNIENSLHVAVGGLAAVRTQHLERGGRTLDLVLTPAMDRAGERLGVAIEWKDVTQQLAMEQEIASVVHAAGEGDFKSRLDESNKVGFMLELAKAMNELTKAVDRSLAETVSLVSAMARGDLTGRMEGDYKGDLLRLKNYVNRMGDEVRSIVGRIAASTGAMQSATQEIGAGVVDLAERTEQQASALEETAASMEEMAATVRQTTGNAQEADRAAASTRVLAVKGGEIASQAVEAMSKIEDSSRQITEIVDLIEEIAFQTNILALNAAVEAARAGDAGRGFAVVANEVRALSQRSSQALKEIKKQIVNSDANVKVGVGLVKQAGDSLTEIVEAVKMVAGLVAEIASASQEQSSGIDQVSKALGIMDQMTQQNSALVEETNAALHSSQAQVDDLRQSVAFFKTGEEVSGPDKTAKSQLLSASDNPVHRQQTIIARKVAPRRSAAAAAEVRDCEEF